MAQELNTVERKKEGKKIALFTFLCMFCVAILLDLFSLIPGLNILTMILGNILFLIWFYFLGVTFTSKKASSFVISGLIEIIPIVSILPSFILNICVNYYLD